MTAKLLVASGLSQGAETTLRTDRPTVVGRARYADLTLPDIHTSKTHCHISFLEGQWTVHDLGSSNGTFVNERRVKSAVLKDGDVIRIGKTTLRFLLLAEPAVEQAPDEHAMPAPPSVPLAEAGLLRLLEKAQKAPEGHAGEPSGPSPQKEGTSDAPVRPGANEPSDGERGPASASQPPAQQSERAGNEEETSDLFSLIKKRIRREEP